jgi:integrase/recombinase XerD
VTRLVWAANIVPCSPHDARRTLISNLLDDGVDLATVQAIAGHANVATTARYDRRGERARRRAMARVNLPLSGPRGSAKPACS